MLVAGDFNIPLHEAISYICTPDKKFDKTPQSNRTILQHLISEFRLIAPHCKQAFRYTFIHDTYISHIDYIFIKEHQFR